jgi:general secretion pathway protein B
MSYILEALKKAQAERQIGSTPTIHAPTLAAAPAGQAGAMRRAPLIVAMVLMAAAIAGMAAMLVRQQPAASHAPEARPVAAIAPAAAAAAVRATERPVAAPAVAEPAVAAASPPPAPAPQPVAAAAAPAEPKPSAAAPEAPPMPAPKVTAAARTAEAAPAIPAAPAPAAPVEEHIQSLQELPEPIQRAIPAVTLGGYMYSKNPADRLLLIDKVLRKEGEEVAPGLLLEKLLPKQAVFRFRGYRYRVPL